MNILQNIWPQWHIIEEIGSGSYGKVYKIEREDIGGKYQAALKMISIPQDQSEINEILAEGMDASSTTGYFRSMVEEIVKEFAVMEELKGHTNIVGYEDHAVVQHEDGIGWDILIRMELLTPLSSHMRFNSMEEKDVIKLGMDMCTALQLCEKSNIIHRDIKAENIFVSKFGDYKLGDFGIARTAEKTMSAMSKKGTYTYMAPEVYRGDSYDSSVDIYSLGIVMYRLMNDNRAPFLPVYPNPITFHDKEASIQKRMSGEQMPKPAHGSEGIKAIILKACAFDTHERYHSAAEMLEDLKKLEKGEYREIPQPPVENISKPAEVQPEAKSVVIQPDAKPVFEEPEERTRSAFDSNPFFETKQEPTPEKETVQAAADISESKEEQPEAYLSDFEEEKTVSGFADIPEDKVEEQNSSNSGIIVICVIVLLLVILMGAASGSMYYY